MCSAVNYTFFLYISDFLSATKSQYFCLLHLSSLQCALALSKMLYGPSATHIENQ